MYRVQNSFTKILVSGMSSTSGCVTEDISQNNTVSNFKIKEEFNIKPEPEDFCEYSENELDSAQDDGQ